MRCMCVDDEPLALAQMREYIKRVPFLEPVAEASNAFEAIEILAKESVDLLFTDINMPDLNGMEFVRSLHQKPLLVFTTAYSEYAVEGFKADAIGYLLKPFGFKEFLTVANKALRQYELMQAATALPDASSAPATKDHIFVKADYKTIRIDLKEIVYIESQSEYVKIHLEEGKPIMTLLSMKSLEESLPASMFMRVHRSYIVNTARVRQVANNRIIINKEILIPVSDQYKEAFQMFLQQNYIGK